MIEDELSHEDKLTQAASKAARAQSLLANELLVEAFKALEDAYTARWRASHIDNDKEREKIFLAINIVGKVRDHLTAVVTNGKLAAAELKQLADTTERKRRFGII